MADLNTQQENSVVEPPIEQKLKQSTLSGDMKIVNFYKDGNTKNDDLNNILKLKVPAEYIGQPEKMKQVMAQFRNSPEFDEIIDKTTGASTYIRTLASPSRSAEDRLATIRKYYS